MINIDFGDEIIRLIVRSPEGTDWGDTGDHIDINLSDIGHRIDETIRMAND